MKTVWTSGISEKERRDEIKTAFQYSGLIRGRLTELLQNKILSETTARLKREDYESASWAYKQADSIGYLRALQEVISLISEK